ncbi:MAG: hypothetical protein B6D41_19500 [Chloroflexi bacterium UTCFX4]|nr:MAG: hypothetical protein B6D41_19500 [Chloroflexi bacterium UTCFX4]
MGHNDEWSWQILFSFIFFTRRHRNIFSIFRKRGFFIFSILTNQNACAILFSQDVARLGTDKPSSLDKIFPETIHDGCGQMRRKRILRGIVPMEAETK